jgi:hypothetical protein
MFYSDFESEGTKVTTIQVRAPEEEVKMHAFVHERWEKIHKEM